MISFEPLYRQLESKRMSLAELSSFMGYEFNNLSIMLKRENVQVSTLVKICKALNCDISDVICYKSIQEEDYKRKHIKKGKGINVNWDKIPGPLYETSVAIGKSSNYLTLRKTRDSGLPEEIINAICERYNLSKEDICD